MVCCTSIYIWCESGHKQLAPEPVGAAWWNALLSLTVAAIAVYVCKCANNVFVLNAKCQRPLHKENYLF